MPIYSDLNSFNPTLKSQLIDVQSVYQSLYNLFNTSVGERVFLSEFGFTLEDELFEVIDDITSVAVFVAVVNAIQRWESRVVIDTTRTTIVAVPDENRYDMDLYFNIQGLEETVFNFQGSFTQ